MIEKIEDIELVKNIINSDKNSEEILYSKYKNIIENYINYNYFNINDFDDVVSEILIKIFSNIKKYDENISMFLTWAINITKNHVCDVLRKKHIIEYVDTNIIDINTHTSDNSEFTCNYTYDNTYNNSINSYTQQSFSSFELNDMLTTITSTINDDDLQLLKMKYFSGYSYNEIAKEFNVTSATVSNKVNYIKTKIKNKGIDSLI